MRAQAKPLRRLLLALGVFLALVVILLVTPVGGWLGSALDAAWRGVLNLPGIAWLRTQSELESGVLPSIGEGGAPGGLADVLQSGEDLEREEAYERALERYREALRLDQEYAPTHQALGRVLMQLGREDEALEVMQRAAELDPEDAAIQWQLAQIHMQREEYDEAVRALEQAREQEPDQALVHMSLGMAYLSRSVTDAENAVSELSLAAEQQPTNAQIFFGLSMAYRNRAAEGDRERAMGAMRRAVELDPSQPQFNLALGRMYLETGDRDAAIALWRRFAEQTDDPEAAAQIREVLRELGAAIGSGSP
jgi:tetratricopeptide (TPR) repeat protein